MSDPSDLISELIEQETRVWEALVAGDRAADEALLVPEFLGVYASGFSDREGHASQLDSGPSVKSFRLAQAHVIEINATTAMLSYQAHFTRADRTKPEAMYVSSLWQKRAGVWLNLFSQDTPTIG